jgi:hypothetical protein
MHTIRLIAVCAGLLLASLVSNVSPVHAQGSVVITVDLAPPPLPVYDQPPIPGPGYIWQPGYWGWNTDVGWYWVPGTWVLPPAAGLLWTPAYWAYSDGEYVLYDGYWAPQVGFYGGIDYGFGYTGDGYEGGYWNNGTFFYNTAVNNITNVVTNVYNKTVVDRNRARISYNGGPRGVRARPTPAQLAVARERHVPPTSEQRRHVQAAARNPAMALSHNHGHPPVAAASRPGQFRGPGAIAAHPGRPIPAAPPAAARAARQDMATMPGRGRGEAPARQLAEHAPRGAPHLTGPAAPGRPFAKGAQREASPPHLAQPTTRPLAERPGPRSVVGPRTARTAAPTQHLLMAAPHQQARFAAPSHVAPAPHFAAPPHVAAPPRVAAAPHVPAAPHLAAPPHVAAPPAGGARGGPPGRHK